MPVVLLLGLGAAGVVEVADAASGLRAATDAAVAAAVRQPSEPDAVAAADVSFRAVLSEYPVVKATFSIGDPRFERAALITGIASGDVDLGWEAMSFLPAAVHLTATATMRVEPWRSH
jgi:hypothetical protein